MTDVMFRLRNAWAALLGRPDPAAQHWVEQAAVLAKRVASLEASLEDATATASRLYREKAGLQRVIDTVRANIDG